MERIRTSPRYVIEKIGTDPPSLGELRGGVLIQKKKNEVFSTYERVIRS